MQLPESLQHFPHPALLIASDSVMAKFFLLGGDSLEELDGVSLPRERKQDAEGERFSADGTRVIGLADTHDEPRLHKFVDMVAKQIGMLVQQHGIAHVHLVMPAEVEHLLSKHLSKPLQTKIVKRVHRDVMKEAPLKIVERVLTTY